MDFNQFGALWKGICGARLMTEMLKSPQNFSSFETRKFPELRQSSCMKSHETIWEAKCHRFNLFSSTKTILTLQAHAISENLFRKSLSESQIAKRLPQSWIDNSLTWPEKPTWMSYRGLRKTKTPWYVQKSIAQIGFCVKSRNSIRRLGECLSYENFQLITTCPPLT